MRLVYTKTEKEVKVGDITTTFRGEKCKVKYFKKPHKTNSSGKVTVEFLDNNFVQEVYVSVIGAEWIEREDRAAEEAFKKFLDLFNREYDFLYEKMDGVLGFREANEEFDNVYLKTHTEMLDKLISYRGDYLTSDREAVAFVFACRLFYNKKLSTFATLNDGDKIISPIDNEVTEFRVAKDGSKYLANRNSLFDIFQFDARDFYIYDGEKEVGQKDLEYIKKVKEV